MLFGGHSKPFYSKAIIIVVFRHAIRKSFEIISGAKILGNSNYFCQIKHYMPPILKSVFLLILPPFPVIQLETIEFNSLLTPFFGGSFIYVLFMKFHKIWYKIVKSEGHFLEKHLQTPKKRLWMLKNNNFRGICHLLLPVTPTN